MPLEDGFFVWPQTISLAIIGSSTDTSPPERTPASTVPKAQMVLDNVRVVLERASTLQKEPRHKSTFNRMSTHFQLVLREPQRLTEATRS